MGSATESTQSDRCVRHQTQGIQKSIARVQAHFSLPHSSHLLSVAVPASLPAIPYPNESADLQAM